jgi:hypothetical protein
LIQQRQSYENHGKLYGKALGDNAIDTNQGDPFVALNSLTTSLSNFAGTLTSPTMESAAGALSSMASAIGEWARNLSEWQKNNPMTAKAIGAGAAIGGAGAGIGLTYGLINGLMSGFGLSTAAANLDASAFALTKAAAALGGEGVASKVGGVAAGGAAGAAGRTGLRGVVGGALRVLGPAAMAYDLSGDTPISGNKVLAQSVVEETKNWRRGRDFTLGSNGTLENNFGSSSSFIPSHSPLFPGGSSSGGFDYRELPIHVEANGQVSGELDVNVKIDAPSYLRTIFDPHSTAQITGQLHGGNGPGSIGRSSPGAEAPAPGLGASR